MIRLIKIAFWMFVGVAVALESEKWLEKLGARMKPNSMAGSLIDRLNTKLEAQS